MRPPKPTTKKLIPGSNSSKMSKALEKPKVTKPTTAVKKTSRGPAADKQMTRQGGKVTITGSATGTKTPKPTNLKNYQKFGMTSKKSK
jgi:hypothetical protein